ncbi:MAG: hypothetical protein B6241_10775, partial [Spirochaetaceae bacterium 4572_59]
MESKDFQFIDKATREIPEIMRPSLTYWQDAWRRLKNHKMAMSGLVGVIFIICFAVFGPMLVKNSYSDQNLDYSNLPPRLDIYQLNENYFVFLTNDYKVLRVSKNGEILSRLEKVKTDPIKKLYTYQDENETVVLDFSYNLLADKMNSPFDFSFKYKGEEITESYKKVFNKTYIFG